MKKIKHFIKNIFYIVRMSYKLAKGQYILSCFMFILNVATPFINLLFPKWILDELANTNEWDKLIFLIVAWAATNGVIVLINTIVNIIATPYQDKCYFRETMHYLKMDATMDYSKIEDGNTLDEQGRIGSNLPLIYFSNNIIFPLVSNIVQLMGYIYIVFYPSSHDCFLFNCYFMQFFNIKKAKQNLF